MKATIALEGFQVLPYISDDPIAAGAWKTSAASR